MISYRWDFKTNPSYKKQSKLEKEIARLYRLKKKYRKAIINHRVLSGPLELVKGLEQSIKDCEANIISIEKAISPFSGN